MPESEDFSADDDARDAARKQAAAQAATELARRLRALHTATGQKQSVLAEHLKVDDSTANRYLKGGLVPRPRQLRGMLTFFREHAVSVTAQEEEELTSLCRDAQRTVERLREVIDDYKEELRGCREQVAALQAEDHQAGTVMDSKLREASEELADLRRDVERLSSDNQFYRAVNEHYLAQEAQHIAWQGTPQEIELRQQIGDLQAEIRQLQSNLVARVPALRLASDAVRGAAGMASDAVRGAAVIAVDAVSEASVVTEGAGALAYVVIIAVVVAVFGPDIVLAVNDAAGPWVAVLAALATPLAVGAALKIIFVFVQDFLR
ncbi:helix-turn-helix domain-containing protein [Streptomyces sp. 900105245]